MEEPPITPTKRDVLSGRGRGYERLEGNQIFRQLINTHATAYKRAGKSRKLKSRIVRFIMNHLAKENIRLLRTKNGNWVEMTRKEGKLKIGHALRDAKFSPTPVEAYAYESAATPPAPAEKAPERGMSDDRQPESESVGSDGDKKVAAVDEHNSVSDADIQRYQQLLRNTVHRQEGVADALNSVKNVAPVSEMLMWQAEMDLMRRASSSSSDGQNSDRVDVAGQICHHPLLKNPILEKESMINNDLAEGKTVQTPALSSSRDSVRQAQVATARGASTTFGGNPASAKGDDRSQPTVASGCLARLPHDDSDADIDAFLDSLVKDQP